MGLSVIGHALLATLDTVSAPADNSKSYSELCRAKARAQLEKVLSGILHVLAEAAFGEVGDLERPTWHLQMACNYLKLAASEHSLAAADGVDAARDRLTDKLFFLQASLVRCCETEGRAEGLLAGLELMAAVSSLFPADASTTELPTELPDEHPYDFL